MSLTATVATKAMELQIGLANKLDPCLLDNKTSGIANDIFLNVRNFALGTGKWIALAILVFGLVAYFFGNDAWAKRGAAAVIILALLGAILAVATGLIGTGNC